MDNLDKTDDWGHFSTGVVVEDSRADVTTVTQTLICSSGYSHGSKSFKCTCQG